MVEFLVAGVPLLFLLLATVQLSLLWTGQGTVDAAAHLAAREVARIARVDVRRARQAAFREAFRLCRARPGASLETVSMTELDVTREGGGSVQRADAGDALCVRLKHGVELVVPWVGRILYALAPGEKVRIAGRSYLMLNATRWVTVE